MTRSDRMDQEIGRVLGQVRAMGAMRWQTNCSGCWSQQHLGSRRI
jgi:hypothetical protein